MKTSPFKFLDSYQKDDQAIFFGREKETEKLYDALSGVKHLLIYGPSGAGKTSLIECGLRNQ
ncbi:MAG: ATP-binding protein, partial [Saprospiraceae bacterium]|nr:ATP-binding protein [Saprospiraceae bacterium]